MVPVYQSSSSPASQNAGHEIYGSDRGRISLSSAQCDATEPRCGRRRFRLLMFCLGNIVSGVFTPVLAKHTNDVSLVDILSASVDRIQRNFEPMNKQTGPARRL
jgi:hypothetical protein